MLTYSLLLLFFCFAQVKPQTFKEASNHGCWKKAMETELQAFEATNTWSFVELPPGKKVVGSRWVYKTKYKADGTLERHKAVSQGFTQMEGVDFLETYSPVAKLTTNWTLTTCFYTEI
jgi:hypothetical protein